MGLRKIADKARRSIVSIKGEKDGSDSIEMIAATAMLCAFIIIGLMILTYVAELNAVNFAAKRCARQIEITGVVDEQLMREQFDAYLRDSETLTNRMISVSDVSYIPGLSENRVQLKDTFRVNASCFYVVQLINPGNFEGYSIMLPIRTSVSGMSEVYYSQREGSVSER